MTSYSFINISQFKNLLLLSLLFFILSFATSSCKVIKPGSYFKDQKSDTTIQSESLIKKELKIKQGDILTISLSSLNPLEDQVFNSPLIGVQNSTNASTGGYLVDKDGFVLLHKIGKIAVLDKTRVEVKSMVEEKLIPFYKDPIVSVSFANHYITVLGDVGTASKLNLPEEQISIFDAIALSNNISKDAKFSNLLIIRESEKGKKIFNQLNLENYSVFSSPFYHLQPNDILVVKPDVDKVSSLEKLQRTQQVTSIAIQAVSLLIILYQAFFRN